MELRQSQRLFLSQKVADRMDVQLSKCFSCAKGYSNPNGRIYGK